ncbi:hypothetical protein [Flavobacterium chryseum]|uniref:hypothetical protein n=1 Tax=Flavobacterium sp. P3160 TaxID=2512113 RepID=UPI001AAD9615|nr:hypothetical protein [Flavobacterium sp. P3160]
MFKKVSRPQRPNPTNILFMMINLNDDFFNRSNSVLKAKSLNASFEIRVHTLNETKLSRAMQKIIDVYQFIELYKEMPIMRASCSSWNIVNSQNEKY